MATGPTTTSPPEDIPNPLVYGPDFPKFKMFLRRGKQVFESRTNQNLYLTQADFTDDGTYPLHQLLKTTGVWGRDKPSSWFFDPMWVATYKLAEERTVTEIELVEELDFKKCPALALLLNYSPDSHRPFHEKYIQSQWNRARAGFEYAVERCVEQNGPISAWELSEVIPEVLLSFPALIPEVWLAAIGYDKTLEDQEYLAEHPQRVDFVLLGQGRKAVIEIDGLNHYSEWDAALGEAIASEEVYTRNLRIERSLRRQGWAIHRFSNYEVRTVDAGDFAKLIAELPIPRGFRHTSATELAEHLERAGDLPF